MFTPSIVYSKFMILSFAKEAPWNHKCGSLNFAFYCSEKFSNRDVHALSLTRIMGRQPRRILKEMVAPGTNFFCRVNKNVSFAFKAQTAFQCMWKIVILKQSWLNHLTRKARDKASSRFPVPLQQGFPKFYSCVVPTSSHVTPGYQVLKWPVLERKFPYTHASRLAFQALLNHPSLRISTHTFPELW